VANAPRTHGPDGGSDSPWLPGVAYGDPLEQRSRLCRDVTALAVLPGTRTAMLQLATGRHD